MVNPVVRAYMELQKPRQKLLDAATRVDAAYLLYQKALQALGPYPRHGWDRRALAAREDSLAAAIEEFGAVIGETGRAVSRLELRPPF